ncbi:MAG TPA: class II glutamine amidotransferase [Nocardioidaceae bacterium]|jgi:predicted glutamine amidotransferase|nr:class II glutamine amidotransferase [Nocardioidaceae bacterium]
MCRLLGVVSHTAAPLTDTLSSDLEPFAALSSIHCDGWGMAYWDAHDDLVVAKAPEAARGSEKFWTAAKEASTDAAVLHLRRASEGMVPDERNTHPFAAGSVAFAHNGFFSPSTKVEGELLQRGGRPPEGDTDSERYFGMVLAAMHDEGPVQALHSTAERIRQLSDQLVSLNALLLTQQALYAFAYWDETAPPRPEAGTATYELMFRVSEDAVTVASDGWEPLGPRWERISNGMVLEVSRQDLRVMVHRS